MKCLFSYYIQLTFAIIARLLEYPDVDSFVEEYNDLIGDNPQEPSAIECFYRCEEILSNIDQALLYSLNEMIPLIEKFYGLSMY